MTLPASGPLTLSDIQTEFGGTNPIGMNEYYAGGGLVPAGTSGTYGTVPSSGALSVQNFYGTSAVIPAYIEEVFSTYLYNGNGSTQTISNSPNLSTNGGLVWIKCRNSSTPFNILVDSARGNTKAMYSNAVSDQYSESGLTTLTSTGFSVGQVSTSVLNVNASGQTYASWTFQKKPKFFDIVTFSTTSSSSVPITVNHNLGSVPACIIVKQTNGASDWFVYHRSLGSTQYLTLNSNDIAQNGGTSKWYSTPTSTSFTLGGDFVQNATYVAYLFAHNAGGFGLTGTDNVISCGSFTTDGSGNATVSLGYEPQWLLTKSTDLVDQWYLLDSMRGWPVTTASTKILAPNTSGAETTGTFGNPTATGFTIANGGATKTYVYIAIRRGPMKVPTSGTTVYNPTLITATQSTQNITSVGFSPDLIINGVRSNANYGQQVTDRLRGVTKQLFTNYESAENTTNGTALVSLNMNGFTLGADTGGTGWNAYSGFTSVKWNFKRAPNFFDEVCYTGTGSATTFSHNLAAVPELMIVKVRDSATNWTVYSAALGNNYYTILNSSDAPYTSSVAWNNTTPTSSVFTVGTNIITNGNGYLYVAYLFATCAGVSKVGSYTGTATTLQVECGFTSGARFVLIKRTDSTGDWYVWDSARGISSGNDPYLLLNSASAEVTGTNYVDTTSVGFQITAAAPSALNASGGSYIFLAIA
jgi:hypothetical protein